MSDALHIYALPDAPEVRHTELSRAHGETAADLPPLAEWLGLDGLDTDRVELFPVSDLGDLDLSQYVDMAFAPATPMARDERKRLDALSGMVLLVPGDAMEGTPAPGTEAQEVARIALARPDHSADLPKADLSRAPAEEVDKDGYTTADRRRRARRKALTLVVLGVMGAILLAARLLR